MISQQLSKKVNTKLYFGKKSDKLEKACGNSK